MPLPFSLRRRPHVYLSFHGDDNDLRRGFISHIVKALKDARIIVSMNLINRLQTGAFDHDRQFFDKIDDSKVALVIFSEKYAESILSLEELKMIHEHRKLMVIPIFYKVNIEEVQNLEGKFGECFMKRTIKKNQRWINRVMGCLKDVATTKPGFTSLYHSDDSKLLTEIILEIKKKTHYISTKQTIGEEFLAELLSASVVSALCFFFIPNYVFPDSGFFISPRWYLAVLLLFVVRHSLRLIQT